MRSQATLGAAALQRANLVLSLITTFNTMLERLLQLAELITMLTPIVVGGVMHFHRISVRLIALESDNKILHRAVLKLVRISVNEENRKNLIAESHNSGNNRTNSHSQEFSPCRPNKSVSN